MNQCGNARTARMPVAGRHNRRVRRRAASAISALLVIAAAGARAADRPAAISDLAVDQVTVKGGPRLLGAVLGREADGAVAFAVGRAWLKKAHARFYEQALRDETAETRAAFQELRDRVAEWRTQRAADQELDFFLKRESERVDKVLKAIDEGTYLEDAPFLVIDLPRAKADRVFHQPPQRRRIALTAWREGLADVETRSTASLAQKLKKQKVELTDDPDVLLELLPPRRQTEAAWAARRGVVEYRFRKPLDFQGLGNQVVRTGEGVKPADAGRLLGELFKSLGSDPRADLLEPAAPKGASSGTFNGSEKWLATAARVAQSAGLDGFRVTRVDQDLAARRVVVEARFVARLPDGSWQTIWQHSAAGDASKPRPDVEQQIEKDPQVRAALELVKSIGLGGDEQVRLAIRFGSATMGAQKEADSRFFEFRDRYLKRLDGPILRVAPLQAARPARK